MLDRNPHKDASSEESAIVSQRLSRRWKLLQVLGAALIALAGWSDRLNFSDPALPATPMFFLMLGIIVFIASLFMQRGRTAGLTAK